jgi:hypothetical protein
MSHLAGFRMASPGWPRQPPHCAPAGDGAGTPVRSDVHGSAPVNGRPSSAGSPYGRKRHPRLSERVCGPGDVTLSAVEEHAAACPASGGPREAARLPRRILAGGQEKARGREIPATLATGERLASVCLAARQPQDAITRYEQVLACRERALGTDHPGTLTTLATLAGDAVRLLRAAIAGAGQALSPATRWPGTCTACWLTSPMR